MKPISVIVPLYNESAAVSLLLDRVRQALDGIEGITLEYVLVDDGSTDDTADVLARLAAAEPRIRVVRLLRNVGHQQALMAGLTAARGDCFLMMDGDGQHPPEVAAQLLRAALETPEYDIVQGIRTGGQSWLKELTARAFYRLIRVLIPELHLTPGASDFRVVTGTVRDTMLSHPDCHRNIRVFLGQFRFRTHRVPYVCDPRLAGRSKYSLRKMARLAFDGVFAFTHFPLRLSVMIASMLMGFGVAFLVYSVVVRWRGETVSGWTSLVGLICLLFSGVFAMLAILSEYIILIHENTGRTLARLAVQDLQRSSQQARSGKPIASDSGNDSDLPSIPRQR